MTILRCLGQARDAMREKACLVLVVLILRNLMTNMFSQTITFVLEDSVLLNRSKSRRKLLHLRLLPGFKKVNGTKKDNATPPTVNSTNDMIAVGKHIEHERFGLGVVEKLEGSGDNMKATVSFQNAGTKQLLLKFARFRVID